MSRPGVPVCLVTGFLGAGKTSLLNHILRNCDGLHAVVFVNEFGAIEIDSTLIRWQGSVDESRIVTLDNGCICCEVNADLSGQLQRVLTKYAGELDLVVIETSGVCDPGPVLVTLERLEDLAFKMHLDSVLAVVDASSLDLDADVALPKSAAMLGLTETAKAQIAHSDVVLLNKCDLIGGLASEQTSRAEEALVRSMPLMVCQQSRPPPRIIRSEHAAVDLALITSVVLTDTYTCKAEVKLSYQPDPPAKRLRSSEVTRPQEKDASHGAHAAETLRAHVRSFAYTADRPFDPLKFEAWVESGGPPSSICRAKGLIWMRGLPCHVVFQLAGSRTNPFETLGSSEPPSGSRIIFIGEAVRMRDGDERAIAAALDACLC